MFRKHLLFYLLVLVLLLSACAPASFIPMKGDVRGILLNKTPIYGSTLISTRLNVTYTELPHLYPAGQENLIYTYDMTIGQHELGTEVTFYCDNYAWGYIKCDVRNP